MTDEIVKLKERIINLEQYLLAITKSTLWNMIQFRTVEENLNWWKTGSYNQ